MTMQQRAGSLAFAVAVFAMACADPSGPTVRMTDFDRPSAAVSDAIRGVDGFAYPTGMTAGEVRVCKTVPAGDPAGVTFTFAVTKVVGVVPTTGQVTTTTNHNIVGVPGQTVCEDVFLSAKPGSELDSVRIVETAPPANWALTSINTLRIDDGPGYTPPNSGLNSGDLVVENVGARSVSLYVNNDMGRVVTFTNDHTAPPPPPAICDFITFGRLDWEHNGLKVVISGNAGGNSPDGGFLNEFHIEVNGVDHHVADITSYGPIAAAPLASATYTNSRRAAGLDKHGHAVELRVWDGGEPGWKFDRFWFNVNGTIVGNATTGDVVDQGNMQYHANCRGPGGA